MGLVALWCAGRKGLLAGHGALSAKAVLLCTALLLVLFSTLLWSKPS